MGIEGNRQDVQLDKSLEDKEGVRRTRKMCFLTKDRGGVIGVTAMEINPDDGPIKFEFTTRYEGDIPPVAYPPDHVEFIQDFLFNNEKGAEFLEKKDDATNSELNNFEQELSEINTQLTERYERIQGFMPRYFVKIVSRHVPNRARLFDRDDEGELIGTFDGVEVQWGFADSEILDYRSTYQIVWKEMMSRDESARAEDVPKNVKENFLETVGLYQKVMRNDEALMRLEKRKAEVSLAIAQCKRKQVVQPTIATFDSYSWKYIQLNRILGGKKIRLFEGSDDISVIPADITYTKAHESDNEPPYQLLSPEKMLERALYTFRKTTEKEKKQRDKEREEMQIRQPPKDSEKKVSGGSGSDTDAERITRSDSRSEYSDAFKLSMTKKIEEERMVIAVLMSFPNLEGEVASLLARMPVEKIDILETDFLEGTKSSEALEEQYKRLHEGIQTTLGGRKANQQAPGLKERVLKVLGDYRLIDEIIKQNAIANMLVEESVATHKEIQKQVKDNFASQCWEKTVSQIVEETLEQLIDETRQ